MGLTPEEIKAKLAGPLTTKAPKTPIEQLIYLRGVTRTTGIIHEAQRLQLQSWPHLVDNQLLCRTRNGKTEIGVEAQVNTVRRELRYFWTSDPKAPPSTRAKRKNYKSRLDALGGWVHELLGDEWAITVELDGLVIYRNVGTDVESADKS